MRLSVSTPWAAEFGSGGGQDAKQDNKPVREPGWTSLASPRDRSRTPGELVESAPRELSSLSHQALMVGAASINTRDKPTLRRSQGKLNSVSLWSSAKDFGGRTRIFATQSRLDGASTPNGQSSCAIRMALPAQSEWR
jgi:hypothetical protein